MLGLVSLPGDLSGLSSAEWLSDVEHRRVSAIAQLLDLLPAESSAVLTSADTLLTELFSHKGERGDKTHTSKDKYDLSKSKEITRRSVWHQLLDITHTASHPWGMWVF